MKNKTVFINQSKNKLKKAFATTHNRNQLFISVLLALLLLALLL